MQIETQVRVMESDGHVQPGTLVNATSRPRFIANQARSQPFVLKSLLRQVAVDSVRRTGRIFRKKVPGHEAEHMVDRVLCRLEASIPSMTYLRKRSARLPAIRLHSMIACGSWSSCSSRMSVNAIGMSVFPVVRRALGVERDSVPRSTRPFYSRAATRPSRTARKLSRKRSVICTSPKVGLTF